MPWQRLDIDDASDGGGLCDGVLLESGGHIAAGYLGPAIGGSASLALSLTYPIGFDTIACDAFVTDSVCHVAWVGGSP